MLLYSDPSFMPKTARGRLPTEPYKLKALPHTVPPSKEHTVLCPVRALKAYLSATSDQEFVNSRETLFLPLNRTNSLTCYHLSKLFADALQFCYSHTTDCAPGEIHSNVHQLRNICPRLSLICVGHPLNRLFSRVVIVGLTN